MRDLKFHFAKAVNILCFGSDGIEFRFEDYGHIVEVKGINLDNPGTTEHPASNASGKSSVQELLSIGLFGKQVKNPTKLKQADILNTQSNKGFVELIWDNYRVVRTFTRSKESVACKIEIWESEDHIWDKDTKKDLGGRGGSADWIADRIGMTHHAFCNVVIFDDSSTYSFLEADAATKRQIVENLLGLDQYRTYHQNSKDYLKEHQALVTGLGLEYQRIQIELDSCNLRLSQSQEMQTKWKSAKKLEIQQLIDRYKSKQELLAEGDTGKEIIIWQEAQERVTELSENILTLEEKKGNIRTLVTEAQGKSQEARERKDSVSLVIQGLNTECVQLTSELTKIESLLSKLSRLDDGAQCPTCHGVIRKENYGFVVNESKEEANKFQDGIENRNASLEDQKKLLKERAAVIKSLEDNIVRAESSISTMDRSVMGARSEISDLMNIPKPEGDMVQKVLEVEVTELKKQMMSKKKEYEGESPYKEIIDQAEIELKEKEELKLKKADEMKAAESELPYYKYWVEAFGDNGIRKFVVDGIIPALNSRIAYWMQYLIDGRIELTFDNKLKETITRNGNPSKYYSSSNGERRRINLAVSQAFSYVMMLNSGTCPSLVFLDEITGGGIDRAGVVGIYNMIFELAKERQIFITTHNENLMTMLQGCETITLKKENDITVLV